MLEVYKMENVDLAVYFGSLKDKDLLDELEEDSKRIGELSRLRT